MLNQEQIDFFHTNGYLIMRGLFAKEEIDLLREAVNAVQADGIARRGELHLYSKNAEGIDTYWRSEEMWKRGAIFRAVTLQPDLLENIGQCVGQAFFPWNDSLVVKLAHSGSPVPFHQDPPYMGNNREKTYDVPNFTTDIYLDHSSPKNGCVWAIPGHHLVGGVDLKSRDEMELFENAGAVPIEMEAGDVLFHCLSTPHGSLPNASDIQRRIFYIHYLAEEVLVDGYLGHNYAEWTANKPGWGERRKAIIEQMMADRADFGWELPSNRADLQWGEGGFTFTGTPITPPRYWGELQAEMSPEEREAKKHLRFLVPA